MDEQYEGPEIQIASEEDYLLPKKEYFAAEVSLAALKPTAFPFDDENYDEDEELEKEHEEVDKETEDTTTILSGLLYLILDLKLLTLYVYSIHIYIYLDAHASVCTCIIMIIVIVYFMWTFGLACHHVSIKIRFISAQL